MENKIRKEKNGKQNNRKENNGEIEQNKREYILSWLSSQLFQSFQLNFPIEINKYF